MATSRCHWLWAFFLSLGIVATSCSRPQPPVIPSVEITKLPQGGAAGPDKLDGIEGRVKGARPSQRIVVYAKGGGVWWVQPLAREPFTELQADATWKTSTHLGSDYAALLVDSNFRPPARTEALPAKSDGVVAVALGKGVPPPAPKFLSFSGYEWEIRQLASDRGGSRNEYDPSNAWTDEKGMLHLRIAPGPNRWTCAEVRLLRSLGYGSYRFVVRDISQLGPAMVFSLFTWDDADAGENHREMDVEISRWGEPSSKNAQYVIQPYYVPANVVRFQAPKGQLSHLFRWEPGRASFKTLEGAALSPSGRVVAEHVFTSGVPTPGAEAVHINLYAYNRSQNPIKNGAEVVIEKFEYLP